MSKPLPLQNQFSMGMRRDVPRNRMPPNSAWNLRDIVLEYGAPARERGGWEHASPNIASITAGSATKIEAGIYATFSTTAGADPQNLAVDEDGTMWKFTTSGATAVGGYQGTNVVAQNPIFHGGAAASGASAEYTGLVIFPDRNLTFSPWKYDGTTLSSLNGSPPKAKFGTVYKDYTVLGHGVVSSITYPNRIWFSPAGDPDCFGTAGVTAWDTTDSWIDFTVPVRGLAATKNTILVFGDGQVARVRGSIPPPDEDMVVDDPWQKIGLLDPFSITVYQDIVYWCAPEGIFRSDGVYLDDLTTKGGMLRYWLDLVANADSDFTFATGIIRNKLVISVLDGSSFHDAFMIDLQNYAWTRLSNLDATSFWDGVADGQRSDETFFGRLGGAYVGRMNPIFEAVGASANKADADGTAVTSIIETAFYELGRPGLKTIKSLFAGYHLLDYASDDPTISVYMVQTPEAPDSDYALIGTLSENASYDRRRIQIGGRYWGMGLKFTRSNAGDFFGYDLSAEVGFQEESKRLT